MARPLWVIRVGLTAYRGLPLYPYKQTSLPCVGMSQMCHNRKSRRRAANNEVRHRPGVAAANLFFNKDMRLYFPLSVGLTFKESHSAAGNWRRLLIHHQRGREMGRGIGIVSDG